MRAAAKGLHWSVMKLKFLPPFTCLAVLLHCALVLPSWSQEDKEPNHSKEPAEEESAEESAPMTPEQFEAQMKKEREEEKASVDKMMKVFSSLEGAWTGRESLTYEENRLPAKSWKDEWEGKFTFGGRYFEMTGQTSGDDLNSAYKWVCTYDASLQRYRAWYFGDNAQNEYGGKLSQDGKYVIWTIKNTSNGSESRFTMKAEDNRVKCHGTDTLADGSLFSTQTSEYTRKRVEL